MKKTLCLLLAFAMLLALAACGGAAPAPTAEQEPEVKEWTRTGYFTDENGNTLSVVWMEDVEVPGWYVGVTIGDDPVEDSRGGMLPQEGNSLHGDLNAWDENAEPLIVTVTEEGEDGLQLVIEGGETYHFKEMDLPKATIFVTVNVEGDGAIEYTEGEETPEIDPEYPFQSAVINLAEPATHTILAWPRAGSRFVKWTKNGEDFSTEPQITVLLDESADFIAVFEEDLDWVNPLDACVGEYQCDRARAHVDTIGNEDLLITVEWGSSAWEMARWFIYGRPDPETMSFQYTGGSKSIITTSEDGSEETEEPVYEEGTGSIVFNEDGSFTWHEDQSESGSDMVFERLPAEEREGFDGLWAEEIAGRCTAEFSYAGEGSVHVVIAWPDSAAVHSCWEMTANVYRDDIMIYNDGHSWVETYAEDGSYTVSDEAFDQSGSFYMEDGKLHWVNDVTGEELVFIPV